MYEDYPHIHQLFQRTQGQVKTSLNDVKQILHLLGNPQHNIKNVIHIAGTNGKGSVCQMLSQVLYKGFDKHVGLFLSPHLVSVNERIQINGDYIPLDILDGLLAQIYDVTRGRYELSFFVTIMLAAFLYVAEQELDYFICEV